MTLSDRVHRALVDQLHIRAMSLGAEVVEGRGPAPLRRAVAVVELYADGAQVDDIAECLSDAEDARRWLDAADGEAKLATELGVIILRASARYAIARGEAVSHEALAALAGMHRATLQRLVTAGDAPQPERERSRGRRAWYAAEDVVPWLQGRGVRI